MVTTLIDPTDESQATKRELLDRPASLDGLTVGLLDIAKARGDVYLNRLEELLVERSATVLRFTKPTFTKPAPIDLRHEISTKCNVVIEALAD